MLIDMRLRETYLSIREELLEWRVGRRRKGEDEDVVHSRLETRKNREGQSSQSYRVKKSLTFIGTLPLLYFLISRGLLSCGGRERRGGRERGPTFLG